MFSTRYYYYIPRIIWAAVERLDDDPSNHNHNDARALVYHLVRDRVDVGTKITTTFLLFDLST